MLTAGRGDLNGTYFFLKMSTRLHLWGSRQGQRRHQTPTARAQTQTSPPRRVRGLHLAPLSGGIWRSRRPLRGDSVHSSYAPGAHRGCAAAPPLPPGPDSQARLPISPLPQISRCGSRSADAGCASLPRLKAPPPEIPRGAPGPHTASLRCRRGSPPGTRACAPVRRGSRPGRRRCSWLS